MCSLIQIYSKTGLVSIINHCAYGIMKFINSSKSNINNNYFCIIIRRCNYMKYIKK